MDVSLEETALCVVDESGRIVKETRAASGPQALSDALRKVDLPLERVGLESCSLTAWLHDGRRGEGWPAIRIETRAANAAMKTMPNKTDRNDARALAQIMRTGWYRQVHVKSRQCPALALSPGRPSHGAERDAFDRERGAGVAARGRQAGHAIADRRVCRRLMSAPGVGPITALAFRATIDRPERFDSSQAVGAHLGLTPARYQSGETDIQGNQPLRRRTRPHRPLRGRAFAARAKLV